MEIDLLITELDETTIQIDKIRNCYRNWKWIHYG